MDLCRTKSVSPGLNLVLSVVHLFNTASDSCHTQKTQNNSHKKPLFCSPASVSHTPNQFIKLYFNNTSIIFIFMNPVKVPVNKQGRDDIEEVTLKNR